MPPIVPGRPAKNAGRRDARHVRPDVRALLIEVVSRARREGNGAKAALALATVVLLSALLSLHLLPDKVSLRAGEISAQEIRAPRTVGYVDQTATAALRAAAAERAEPVYVSVPYAFPETDHDIGEAYAVLRQARQTRASSSARVAALLRQQVGIAVASPGVLQPLLRDAASPFHLDQAERITRQVVHEAMSREIRNDQPDDLVQARAALSARLRASLLPRAYVPSVAALARAVLRPNRLFDRDKTEAARQHERRLVQPQHGQVFAGDVIVRSGETVSPAMIDKFRALGLQNPRLDWGMVGSVTLLIALLVGIVGVYLACYHRPVYASFKLLALICLVVVLAVLGLKLSGTILGLRLSEAQFGFIGILAVAASGMLIAALVHPRVAMLTATLTAALSCLLLGSDLRFMVMMLLSSFVAIFCVSDIRSRSDVARAMGILCVTNVVLSLIVGRIAGDGWADLSQSAVWAAVCGFSSVALFWLGAALFERPFGVTTHLGLLELSDPNRALLKRFSQTAPGTFVHSVMVGNLAVAAAEAVGADALLCRVGAYYHDLGKMRLPEYFVENQRGDNVHDRLNPSLSALAVTAHVKYGLEIAEREKLPPIIKSFITEHHGTSLVRYFYFQQTAGGEDAGPGLEQCFRYGGPKPQSRETAILMLADGVEAASRTLEKPTLGRLENLVAQIINTHLSDGQLDECDLTLRDLRGIRDAFVRLLGGMLHTRVEYPELKPEKNAPADFAADTAPVGGFPRDPDEPARADAAA